MGKYRVGIVSAGVGAKRMSKALHTMEDRIIIGAIASRNMTRAERIARKYNIEKVYATYEELAEDPEIDIVYIATVNSLHKDLIELYLNHGKNVLCEKPFVLQSKDAERLYALAKKKNLFLGEAMWILFLPYMKELKKMLNDQKVVGDIQYVSMRIGYDMRQKERLTDPKLGGGALYDIGVYEIALCHYLFGNEISVIRSTQVLYDTGVDGKNVTFLKYENGMMVTMISDMTNTLDNSLEIIGSEGSAFISDFLFANKIILRKHVKEPFEEVEIAQTKDIYSYEWDALIEALEQNKIEFEDYNAEKSIMTIMGMERVRKEWQGEQINDR